MAAVNTSVEIINLALSHLGSRAVVNQIDPPKTNVETLAAQWYAAARREALQKMMPNFSLARKKVAKLATVPAFGHSFNYEKPADALRILGVGEADNTTEEFNVEGDAIQSSVDYTSGMPIRYVKDVTNVNLYTSDFISYFSLALAIKLAPIIISDRQKQSLMKQDLREEMNDLAAIQAQENKPIRVSRSRFQEAKRWGKALSRRKL